MSDDIRIQIFNNFDEFQINFSPKKIEKELIQKDVKYEDYLEHLKDIYIDIYEVLTDRLDSLKNLQTLVSNHYETIINIDFLKDNSSYNPSLSKDLLIQKQKDIYIDKIFNSINNLNKLGKKIRFQLQSDDFKENYNFEDYQDYDFEILNDNISENISEDDYLKKEVTKILLFLNNRINDEHSKIVEYIETKSNVNKKKLPHIESLEKVLYDSVDRDKSNTLANEVFFGDLGKLELLIFFNENFTISAKNFTDKTKYTQIYFYLTSICEHNIPKKPYQELVKNLFGYDYKGAEIKGTTYKHQTFLGKIHSDFKDIKS